MLLLLHIHMVYVRNPTITNEPIQRKLSKSEWKDLEIYEIYRDWIEERISVPEPVASK